MNLTTLRALIALGLNDSQIEGVQAIFGAVPPPVLKGRIAEPQPLLLSYAERVAAGIAKLKPKYSQPTWMVDGLPYTTVTAIVDLMGCWSRNAGKLRHRA